MKEALRELKDAKKVVGLKQSKRAIIDGDAISVFAANDADKKLIEPVIRLCGDKNISVTSAFSMKEIGEACGLSVGAAVSAILK